MNAAELRRLIDCCIAGDILPEEHQALQRELQADPQARAIFREVVDLEASLRTWATECADGPGARSVDRVRRESRLARPYLALFAIAASIAVLALSAWLWRTREIPSRDIAGGPDNPIAHRLARVGTVVHQEHCVWSPTRSLVPGSRFSTESLSLVSGVARLRFDSGTEIVMQGPCELQVASADTAHLLAGDVVIHVTELSDGFTLQTPDATIIDEGTEYAVSLNDEATEIHVFEGNVIWDPVEASSEATSERIEAGEARRYLRSNPAQGSRIPLKMVRFVRRLEADVRENSGAELAAYDGFENVAGRIQRGRSGFGWSSGWESGHRVRGRVGTIVDAPEDTVFGIARSGRRLLQLASGEAIWRDLEHALPLEPGDVYYLSFLQQRHPGQSDSGRYLQVSLRDSVDHPRGRSRSELAFGVTSDGFPFIKTEGRIIQSAPGLEDGTVYLFVAKIVVSKERSVETYLRVYDCSESIEENEPSAWTAIGRPTPCEFTPSRIRLEAGPKALIDLDELRIGTTWRSVTAPTER
jgi:ferric-dicitrate binding protein FerR (iron transport regulator)